MQGKAAINPELRRLADFIRIEFGVSPVNIIYDEFDSDKIPRLNICFEFSQYVQQFYDATGFRYDDQKKKLISDRFEQIIREQNSTLSVFSQFNRGEEGKFRTDRVFIFFSSFNRIAMAEANESIPEERIRTLTAELNNKDLWTISRFGAGTTFFLYSDRQKKEYEEDGKRKFWADMYFGILKPYDEFGYFKREGFNIMLDSKENFDNQYQSNWYYYYK